MQHETLGSNIHMKWLARNVYIYISKSNTRTWIGGHDAGHVTMPVMLSGIFIKLFGPVIMPYRPIFIINNPISKHRESRVLLVLHKTKAIRVYVPIVGHLRI